MSNDIELHSYCIGGNISDSEEYHEINEICTESLMENAPPSPRTQAAFFTETKKIEKNKKKRGSKVKRTQHSRNLMKIVTNKINHESPPIVKNVINILEKKTKHSYLESQCKLDKILNSRPRTVDIEHGDPLKSLKLSPKFYYGEKTLDTRDIYIHTDYVEPNSFENILSDKTKTDLKATEMFLDISINSLNFTYHHSFPLEKILSIKLEENYMEYIETEKHITYILRAIDVNRETRDNLKVKFTKISANKNDNIIFDTTILKYTSTFLDFKEKYYEKLNEKRIILRNIISLWSDIKCLRHKSGIVSTPNILEIEKLYESEKAVAENWNILFQQEYTDLLIQLEFDYAKKYMEYKQLKSDKTYDKSKLVKPKLHIDPERMKHDVEKLVNFLLSPEDVSVSLKFDETIQKVKPKTEARTEDIYFKVYVDDAFVCETEHQEVKDYSAINYKDSFTLQLLQNNRTLTFILCERSEDMSTLTMDLDEIHKRSMGDKKIVYSDKIEPTSSHVGNGYTIKDVAAINGIRLKSEHLFKGNLITICEMKMSVSWNDTFKANGNSSLKQCVEVKKKIHSLLHGVDKPKLSTIIDVLSDVYDIKIDDKNVIRSLKDMCRNTTEEDYVDFSENINCTRFKLLKLRNGCLINNNTIPLFESQITTEQFSTVQESETRDCTVEYFESQRADMDPIDLQRYVGMKFIEKLNKKISADLNERLMRKTHKDVVKDYQDLSLRSIFSIKTNMSLTSSYSATKQSIDEGLAKDQEIYITVLRGFNLFDRSDTEGQEDEDIAGFKVRPLRPFLRLSYNNESMQTCTAVGNNPTWNYTVTIKTKLNPLSSIYINIYDEHKVNDSQEPEESFRYRCHNKWLGTLAIPISTVLNLGSLRGTFKITSPPIIFGYESAPNESSSVIPEIIRLMKKDTAYLTLRITTSLSHLGALQLYNQPCDADDHILRHLNNFVTAYLNEFPTRNLSLTFIDGTGRHKCVTEFIQPLPLPELFDTKPSSNINVFEPTDMTRMVNLALRYVSLIPTYEVIHSHIVTLSGIELLKVLYGSPLDHTLLLASYLTELGIKCYVAIGYGLPRGLSSYVLVKYDGRRIVMATDRDKTGFLNKEHYDVFILDAVNGEKHDVRDVGCPMKSVNFVFDCENIWVNAQSYRDCENVSFDFKKTSNWRMVFDTTTFVLKHTVITTDIYTPPFDVSDLRDNLEAKLKEKVQKWRWNVKTIWNRYLSRILRESLTQWEYWSFNTDDAKPSAGDQMKQLSDSYKIFGFPINIPYVNAKSVISRVKSTMLHVNDDPNAELALAVEVYAYPNNVLSVWVFLASVTRK